MTTMIDLSHSRLERYGVIGFYRGYSPQLREEIVREVNQHLQILAHRFANRRVTIEDLIDEGEIGVVRALNDPWKPRQEHFVTHLFRYIETAMRKYVTQRRNPRERSYADLSRRAIDYSNPVDEAVYDEMKERIVRILRSQQIRRDARTSFDGKIHMRQRVSEVIKESSQCRP